MALVTFMSDYGTRDHYVASVKARMLRVNPGLQLIDITHAIEPYSVMHAAHVLKYLYRDFPQGTVHVVAVGSHNERKPGCIAVKQDDHFFVGPDNGVFSLITEQVPAAIVDLSGHLDQSLGSFPARSIYAETAARLASGADIQDMGRRLDDMRRFTNRHLRAASNQLSGQVIHIDHYGNLVTNIDRQTFDDMRAGRSFKVRVARDQFSNLQEHYHQVDNGEVFVLFNDTNLLEIGINMGNAAQLLGIGFDYPVHIFFE